MACPVNVPILGCCVTAPPGAEGVKVGIFARAIGYEDYTSPASKAIYKRATVTDKIFTPDGDGFAVGVFETDLDGVESLISHSEDAKFKNHKATWGNTLTRTTVFSQQSPYSSQVTAYNELAAYMDAFAEVNFGSKRNEIVPIVYRYSFATKALTYVPPQNPDLTTEEHGSYLSSHGSVVAYSTSRSITSSSATPLPARVANQGTAGNYIGMSGPSWGATIIFLSRQKLWTRNPSDPLFCTSIWRPAYWSSGATHLECISPIGTQPGLYSDGYYFPHIGRHLNHNLPRGQMDVISAQNVFYAPTADARFTCCRPPT